MNFRRVGDGGPVKLKLSKSRLGLVYILHYPKGKVKVEDRNFFDFTQLVGIGAETRKPRFRFIPLLRFTPLPHWITSRLEFQDAMSCPDANYEVFQDIGLHSEGRITKVPILM